MINATRRYNRQLPNYIVFNKKPADSVSAII